MDSFILFLLLFFAVLLVLGELQLRFYMKYMIFLYYSWGKAILDFFIGTMCLHISGTNITLTQIPIAVYMFVLAVMFLVSTFFFRKTESENASKARQAVI